MTPIEVYKELPRTNCGKCPAGTCMSFAVQFLRRTVSLSDCPGLDEESAEKIRSMLPDTGDWKEKRLEELFREVSAMDFPDIAKRAGAECRDDLLRIRYMGRDIALGRSGFEDEMDILDKLLIMMYLKNRGTASPSGKWVAFRDLKDGLIRAESFHGACEIPIAKMLQHDTERLLKRLSAMGAERAGGFSADYSLVVYPLPRIPFLVLLWRGDEEFGAECKLLTDSTAADFLDVEALLYLGMALVRALK
ncbi:MAG: DUF3786 domain-containing protein [Deferribacteres bacterium]|nr:DUF3786 domain-containing protein [Deferribacteres bacterium]